MDVLIVGAGLAGLMAAHELRKKGFSILVVDKGRSVGGRLATRRIGPGQADTGAQFFTVRTGAFRARVIDWTERGLVFTWSRGWATPAGPAEPDNHPRYAVSGGMNALAKDLGRDLPVHVNVKISGVSPVRDGWQVTDTEGRIYACRAALLTAPVPQSLTLIETGRAPMMAGDLEALRRVEYAPCLAGLYWLDRPAQFPEPGAMQAISAKVSWAADNHRKGVSGGATVLTVHGSSAYSQERYQARDADVLAELLEEVRPWLGDATVQEMQLKRWRYALPAVVHPRQFLLAEGVPPLAFAGDAFGEPRVEGAAVSGMLAADAVSQLLLKAAR